MIKEVKDRLGADEEENSREQLLDSKPRRWTAIAGLFCLILSLLIYILRLDNVIGLMVDDAWYVLLAKSLATGQGYTLINSPSGGILPLYPPGFPFLLSIFFRLNPDFPDNLWLLKSVSIVAMIGAGILFYFYFNRGRSLPALPALGIALASVICPPLVALATSSVMSECVFTLILIVTVVAAERCVQVYRKGDTKAWLYAVASAFIASYAFLTRSVAIGLIAAVFLYLLKERLFRAVLIFAIAVTLFVAPWVIYTRLHSPTPAQQKEQGGHIVQPYTDQFWQRVASDKSSGTIAVGELPSRVWNNVLEIAGRDILRIIAAPYYETLRDPYREAQKLLAKAPTDKTEDTILISFILAVFVMIGFISVMREKITLAEIAVPILLGVIVLWPWETIRLVLPMTPFILFYFAMGFRAIHRLIRAKAASGTLWVAPSVAIALMIGINLFGNTTYLSKKLSHSALDRPQWLQTFDDAGTMLGWIRRSIPHNETIVTLNPPLVYLYTGHRTVAWEDPAENWELWKRLDIRYLARLAAFHIPAELELRNYRTVYRVGNSVDFRVVDLGPGETRGKWGEIAAPSTAGNISER